MFVIIEQGCCLSTDLCGLLRNAARTRKYLGPIGSINYHTKDIVQLQVADMIAYESFKFEDNNLRRPEKPMRKSLQKIIEGNLLRAYLIDDEWLDKELPFVQKFYKDNLGKR